MCVSGVLWNWNGVKSLTACRNLRVNVPSVVVPYRTSEAKTEDGTDNLKNGNANGNTSDNLRIVLHVFEEGAGTSLVVHVIEIGGSAVLYASFATGQRKAVVGQFHLVPIVKSATFQESLGEFDSFFGLLVVLVLLRVFVEGLLQFLAKRSVELIRILDLEECVHSDGHLEDENDEQDGGVRRQHARTFFDGTAASQESGDENYRTYNYRQNRSEAEIVRQNSGGIVVVQLVHDADDD